MSTIKKQDAKVLSGNFDAAATAVSNYLIANYADLSAKEIERIRSLRWTLFDLAEEMTQRAIGVVLDGLEGDLKAITSATEKATAAVKKLKDVGKVVAITSTLIDLAMSVTSGNIGGIADAIGKLADLVKKEEPKPNAKPTG